MNIDAGISTGLFYKHDLIESLNLIKLGGFQNIEIWGGPGKDGEYIHYRWHRPEYTQELAVHLQRLELKVFSLHAPYCNELDISDLNDHNRSFAVKEIQKTAQILKRLDGKTLVIHPAVKEFDLGDLQHKRQRIAQCKKSLSEILVVTRELGLKVAIETLLPHILGGQIEVIQELTNSFDKNLLGICFDTSHVHLWPGTNLLTELEKVAERILTFHISDNYGRYDDHFPPGDGTIAWPNFFETLSRLNYQGVVILEVLNNSKPLDSELILPQLRKKIEGYLERINARQY